MLKTNAVYNLYCRVGCLSFCLDSHLGSLVIVMVSLCLHYAIPRNSKNPDTTNTTVPSGKTQRSFFSV